MDVIVNKKEYPSKIHEMDECMPTWRKFPNWDRNSFISDADKGIDLWDSYKESCAWTKENCPILKHGMSGMRFDLNENEFVELLKDWNLIER